VGILGIYPPCPDVSLLIPLRSFILYMLLNRKMKGRKNTSGANVPRAGLSSVALYS